MAQMSELQGSCRRPSYNLGPCDHLSQRKPPPLLKPSQVPISPRVKEAKVLSGAQDPILHHLPLHLSEPSMAPVPPTHLDPLPRGPCTCCPLSQNCLLQVSVGPCPTFFSLSSHVSFFAKPPYPPWSREPPVILDESKALIITGSTVHIYLFTSLLSTSLHCDVRAG